MSCRRRGSAVNDFLQAQKILMPVLNLGCPTALSSKARARNCWHCAASTAGHYRLN